MRNVFIIFNVLVLCGCGGGAQWGPLPESLPKAAEHPDAEGVHLSATTRVDFHLDPVTQTPYALEHTHEQRVILRPTGTRLGHIGVNYSRGLYELERFDVRAKPPGGEQRTYELSQAADRTVSRGAFYSDARQASINTKAGAGALIEYRTVVRYSDIRMFGHSHFMQRGLPLLETRFEVSAPEAWEIEHQARQMRADLDLQPEVRVEGGRRIYTWMRKNQPSLRRERKSPPWQEIAPLVSVRLAAWEAGGKRVENLRDAKAVSAYQHQLQEDRVRPTPALKAQVKTLLKAAPANPRKRAKILYDWVRENIRYVGIQIGYGGWIPSPARETFERRYGDCKDKATLLSSMLAVAGIPSRIGSIWSHSGYPRRYGLPQAGANANHVILAIDLPGGTVYADSTDRSVPFGRLPFRDQEAELLPAKPGGQGLVVTPASGPEDNWLEVELELKLVPGAASRGALRLKALGDLADGLRTRLVKADVEARRKAFEAYGSLNGKVKKVLGTAAVEPPDELTPVEGSAEVTVPPVVAGSGAHRVLRVGDLFSSWTTRLPAGKRRFPVIMGVRRRVRHAARIQIPEGLRVAKLPKPFSSESPFGRFSLEWKKKGQEVEVVRTFVTLEREIPPERYEALRTWLDGALRAEAKGLVLSAGGPS